MFFSAVVIFSLSLLPWKYRIPPPQKKKHIWNNTEWTGKDSPLPRLPLKWGLWQFPVYLNIATEICLENDWKSCPFGDSSTSPFHFIRHGSQSYRVAYYWAIRRIHGQETHSLPRNSRPLEMSFWIKLLIPHILHYWTKH